LLIC